MTGFRVDIRQLRRKFGRLQRDVNAAKFRPELTTFVDKTLRTAAQTTPVRSLSLIQANQSRQYDRRVNFIPSSHRLIDPSLRVRGNEHWLYSGGKWYRADLWRLSPVQWAQYQDLLSERDRRLSTPRARFISERAQARSLYRKSWSEVQRSLGLRVTESTQVVTSHSRRKPPVVPPRGYGQWRGGKSVLSIVIRNPFLDQPSDYKDFNAQSILLPAMQRHRGEYLRSIDRKYKRMLRVAMR